jgi:hypothetical protein
MERDVLCRSVFCVPFLHRNKAKFWRWKDTNAKTLHKDKLSNSNRRVMGWHDLLCGEIIMERRHIVIFEDLCQDSGRWTDHNGLCCHMPRVMKTSEQPSLVEPGSASTQDLSPNFFGSRRAAGADGVWLHKFQLTIFQKQQSNTSNTVTLQQ